MKQLIKRGHKVTVICERPTQIFNFKFLIKKFFPPSGGTPSPHFAGPRQRRWPKAVVKYEITVGKNEKFKKFRIWWWMWKNRQIIREADVVHAHDVGFWYWPFRFLFWKKPFYITFHGYEGYPPTKKQILIRKINEFLAWKNICIGAYLAKWYGTKPDYISYGAVE